MMPVPFLCGVLCQQLLDLGERETGQTVPIPGQARVQPDKGNGDIRVCRDQLPFHLVPFFNLFLDLSVEIRNPYGFVFWSHALFFSTHKTKQEEIIYLLL